MKLGPCFCVMVVVIFACACVAESTRPRIDAKTKSGFAVATKNVPISEMPEQIEGNFRIHNVVFVFAFSQRNRDFFQPLRFSNVNYISEGVRISINWLGRELFSGNKIQTEGFHNCGATPKIFHRTGQPNLFAALDSVNADSVFGNAQPQSREFYRNSRSGRFGRRLGSD